MSQNKFPTEIRERLQKENLVTLPVLQMLAEGELKELALSMGNRMILKKALNNL